MSSQLESSIAVQLWLTYLSVLLNRESNHEKSVESV